MQVYLGSSVLVLLISITITMTWAVSVLDQEDSDPMSRSSRGGKDDALVNSALMRSLDQIDKYLNDLNVYYSVLGRPRFSISFYEFCFNAVANYNL